MKRIVYRILPSFIVNFYIKKVKHPPCVRCGEIGILKLNEKEYICENCAQIVSELGDMQDD